MSLQLGIDTGGTYTDAVLVDSEQHVIAKHKSLTTSYDLTVGIGNAIRALPAEKLADVNLVALSTTLSTNSVVEGRGAPVCVLLAGYNQKQIEKSGLLEIIDAEYIHLIDGGHNATGRVNAELDVIQARQIIAEQQDKVSAFAISGMFGIRNNAHEKQLRDLVQEISGKPAACGHELASSLGAPRRALTTALNSRMILYITALISSVEQTLDELDINAALMIVKGDGSLVNTDMAKLQPVSTVLSGPAASVIGGCALSKQDNALVVDMGGTTTDIAVVSNGQPELCDDGAVIGDWQPMVEAIRVFSIGLGGDSEVRYRGGLDIGQRRVVPMSLLVAEHPELLARLKAQLKAAVSPRLNRFALRLQSNDVLIAKLNDDELRAWQALQEGPVELDSLVQVDRPLSRAIARLERMGLAIYSGFTPSDATHVLGMSDHWNREAAVIGAQIWAKQMRHLYGCGTWDLDDPVQPCQEIFDLVIKRISEKLIEAGLNQQGKLFDARAQNITRLLADIVLENNKEQNASPLFELEFARNYPLVAVGGPAGDYFPHVAKMLNVDLHLPDNADTANAIGAVMGAVVQMSHITVTQPSFGTFLVFQQDQPLVFDTLDAAITKARELALSIAEEQALRAGAKSVETRIKEAPNHITNDIDGELFVSTTITAIASGRPVL